MKVLTLHQPWASLIALGVKTIETRSWSTKYRGPLAIHAGAAENFAHSWDVGDYRCYRGDGRSAPRAQTPHMYLRNEGWATRPEVPIPLPLGAVTVTCELVDVVPIVSAGSMNEPPWCADTDDRSEGIGHLYLHRTGSLSIVDDQRPYGDFTPGRFAWLLADVEPVDPPVPFKGGQRLSRSWEPA